MLLLTLIIRSFHRSNNLWSSFLCRYLLRDVLVKLIRTLFFSHLFIAHGRQLPVSSMISLKIVVTDIRRHVLLHEGPRRLGDQQQLLMFQTPPEALHHRIVPAGADVSHAAPEPVAFQHRLEATAGIL